MTVSNAEIAEWILKSFGYDVIKDMAGHEFHGNQYSQGSGSGPNTTSNPDLHRQGDAGRDRWASMVSRYSDPGRQYREGTPDTGSGKVAHAEGPMPQMGTPDATPSKPGMSFHAEGSMPPMGTPDVSPSRPDSSYHTSGLGSGGAGSPDITQGHAFQGNKYAGGLPKDHPLHDILHEEG